MPVGGAQFNREDFFREDVRFDFEHFIFEKRPDVSERFGREDV